MKIEIKSKIESTSLETVDIHIEFNPMDERDEGLAAVVVTITDLVKEYNRLHQMMNEADNG